MFIASMDLCRCKATRISEVGKCIQPWSSSRRGWSKSLSFLRWLLTSQSSRFNAVNCVSGMIVPIKSSPTTDESEEMRTERPNSTAANGFGHSYEILGVFRGNTGPKKTEGSVNTHKIRNYPPFMG